MKWILYLLLASNASFLAWQVNRDPPPPPPEPVSRFAHVNRLLLVSEVAGEELRERVPPKEGPLEVAAASTAADALEVGPCYSVGPLSDAEEVERMAEWLREREGKAALRADERREIALYWVYLPPFDDAAGARAIVEEMKGRGIEDIFIIARGDMANAVSLGVYSRKSSLERRLDELRGYGYEAVVAPRYRTKKATWYDVRFEPGFEFPADRFTLAFPSAQAREVSCPPEGPRLKQSGLPAIRAGG
jgi:hypothetical protein